MKKRKQSRFSEWSRVEKLMLLAILVDIVFQTLYLIFK